MPRGCTPRSKRAARSQSSKAKRNIDRPDQAHVFAVKPCDAPCCLLFPARACPAACAQELDFFQPFGSRHGPHAMQRQCALCCIAKANAWWPRKAGLCDNCAAQHQWMLCCERIGCCPVAQCSGGERCAAREGAGASFLELSAGRPVFLLPALGRFSSFRILFSPFWQWVLAAADALPFGAAVWPFCFGSDTSQTILEQNKQLA